MTSYALSTLRGLRISHQRPPVDQNTQQLCVQHFSTCGHYVESTFWDLMWSSKTRLGIYTYYPCLGIPRSLNDHRLDGVAHKVKLISTNPLEISLLNYHIGWVMGVKLKRCIINFS